MGAVLPLRAQGAESQLGVWGEAPSPQKLKY